MTSGALSGLAGAVLNRPWLHEHRQRVRLADKARAAGDAGCASQWMAAVHEAKERTGAPRDLLKREWMCRGDAESLTPSGG